MDIILIPGLWLNGSSWDGVVPSLEWYGHRPHAVTLPGMASIDDDRHGITLARHVAAVVDLLDSIDADRPVMLVGHSAGCAVAYAVVDARPDRVTRLVLVGGFPTPDGGSIADDFPADGDDVPLPEWLDFDESDLGGLDDDALARFRASAVPSPAGVTTDLQRLGDERRRGVPCTAVCTEYSTTMLRGWIADEMSPVKEFAAMSDVTYVDLPTGHWPQFSRPHALARLLDSCTRLTPGAAVVIDPEGRIEPPCAGDEVATLLGFLEFQRSTFAWKCFGPDPLGMQATVGVSPMTLGGLLKHMAIVEDWWFSCSLHGNEYDEAWLEVDWQEHPDWDWETAATNTPGELATIWHDRVRRSRELTAVALARDGLDTLAARPSDFGTPSLRWILTHMIEEYARHNGHADLIRETVDGTTGE